MVYLFKRIILLLLVLTSFPAWAVAQFIADQKVLGFDYGRAIAKGIGLPTAAILRDTISANPSLSETFTSGLADSKTFNDADNYFPYDSVVDGFMVRKIDKDPRFNANIERLRIPLSDVTFNIEELYVRESKKREKFAEVSNSIVLNTGRVKVVSQHILIQRGLPDVTVVATQPPTDRKGNPIDVLASADKRIWGGIKIDATNDSYKDTVAIKGHGGWCSGTLVTNKLVVTAAHCVCGGVNEEVFVGVSIIDPIERIKVKLFETYKECMTYDNDYSLGDVAVIELDREVSAAPRRVGSLPIVLQNASIRAVGFGKTGESVGIKYMVNIIIASYQCNGYAVAGLADAQVYRCRPSHELVAAGLNKDTCGGDSGGPIIGFGSDNYPYLVGVTSRSIDATGKCGPGGIYEILGVSPLREWLESKNIRFSE